MNMKIIAKSPIAHGEFLDGADTGNVTLFRKVPFIIKGSVENIPTISGNAIRGILRRLLSREFFEISQIKKDLTDKENDRLYAVMAVGGALSKDIDVGVDPQRLRELRAHLPVLSVLGSACYHFILSGMLNVGFAVLDCAENGKGSLSICDMLQDIGQTKYADKEIMNSENTDVKPMPYLIEAIAAGSTFSGTIDFLPQTTDLEKSAIGHALRMIKTVGMRSAVGYGKIDIDCPDMPEEESYLEYLQHIDDHREEIIAFARSL